jgi:hypothetical protein
MERQERILHDVLRNGFIGSAYPRKVSIGYGLQRHPQYPSSAVPWEAAKATTASFIFNSIIKWTRTCEQLDFFDELLKVYRLCVEFIATHCKRLFA